LGVSAPSSPSDTSAALAEAHETAGLLLAAAERTRWAFESAVAELGLTPVQARTLLSLEQPIPMREMAAALHCDASNITGIADRLTARGLVAREPDPDDRRVKLLALTTEGQQVRERLERTVSEASPLMAALDADDRAALRTLLLKALGTHAATPGCG
jgi:DNA-binding MarR family transcriptional regulator